MSNFHALERQYRLRGKSAFVSLAILLSLADNSKAQDISAEKVFSFLMFGPSYEDTCSAISDGVKKCPIEVKDKVVFKKDEVESVKLSFSGDYCDVTVSMQERGGQYKDFFTIHMKALERIQVDDGKYEGGKAVLNYNVLGAGVFEVSGKKHNGFQFKHFYKKEDVKGKEMPTLFEVANRMNKAVDYYHSKYCGKNPF